MSTTVSFGNCAACGDQNNKQAQFCRKCNAALPWSEIAMAQQSGKDLAAARLFAASENGGKVPQMKVVGQRTPLVSNAQLAHWSMGLFVFCMCAFTTPIGGYCIHRVLSHNESDFEGFAFAGMCASTVIFALLFVIPMRGSGPGGLTSGLTGDGGE